ncbi:MAG: hypothetical protein GY849_23480, partial [Deltaproteobacteria bacterium]|nr:hypothetical protein [Deltaproteobacteria bacterium]
MALSEILRPPFAGSTPRTLEVFLPGLLPDQRTVELGPDAPTAYRVSRMAGPAEVRLVDGVADRPLVVRAETSYLPAADGSQVAPRRDGFVVTRELLLQTSDPPVRVPLEEAGKTVELGIGDVVEEHVRVVNPADRHYVAVVVPLAA